MDGFYSSESVPAVCAEFTRVVTEIQSQHEPGRRKGLKFIMGLVTFLKGNRNFG